MKAPEHSLFDPWARAPHLAHLRDAALSGDVAGLSAGLEVLDGDELSFAVWLLAELDDLATRPGDGADGEPDGEWGAPELQLLAACVDVVEGWHIRSSRRAHHVSADQFERFHARLRRAEGRLLELCARRPEFGPAWQLRITVALGLQLGGAEARRRYDRVRALDPWCYPAQAAFLQQVCPKWGGSWPEAHAFVAECRDGAPPGSLSPAVAVSMHLEQWVSVNGGATGARYLGQSAVLEDLRSTALATVWHPDHVAGPDTATVHSRLAMAFALAGMPALAAPHFRVLGDHPAEADWGYTGDAEGAYRRHRATAQKAEGGR